MSGSHLRALVCAAAIWAALPQRASARCTLALAGEFTVDTVHAHAFTTGEINGNPVRILIDTGSTFSYLWRGAAQRLGLRLDSVRRLRAFGVGGEAEVHRTWIRDLQIGTLLMSDVHPLVLGGGASSGDAGSFALGDDVLSNFDTEFDLAHGKIRLFHARGCQVDQVPYWAHTFSLADLDGWNPAAPRIVSRVQVNGRPISAMLDTGAQLSAIDRQASARAGVTPWTTHPAPVGSVGGVGSERVATWVGTFDTLSIGDEQIAHVPLVISDMFRADKVVELGSHIARPVGDPPSMVIGIDFFMAHRMLVMQKQRKMVFTYNGGRVFWTREIVPAR